jgi:signal transduction histidine kinase
VGDLLDIARIESERGFSLNKVSCNISDIISQVVPYFQEHTKKHRFEVVLPENPVELYVDKQKMEQVLKNLISNAIKYSPDGGLICVASKALAGYYEVSVADQGIGMAPEQVDKIFEKFYRADASNTAIEGTGLGMTIVKYIVEGHGGNIWVESEAGKGTTVRFTIPT